MDYKKIALLALCALGGWHWHTTRAIPNLAPGVGVAEAPYQRDVSAPKFSVGKYTITPLASFDIRARILSRQNYSADKEADLSPIDLALGWGRMSDVAVYSQFDISQSGRFYFWRSEKELPIPYNEVVRSSANMHLIPADSQVEAKLRKTRPGQIIHIQGYLVRADDPAGWAWRSSLTREDSGAGACEIIWVKTVEFEDVQG
jgi:hypothetical protein